jgi:hypothetical protein
MKITKKLTPQRARHREVKKSFDLKPFLIFEIKRSTPNKIRDSKNETIENATKGVRVLLSPVSTWLVIAVTIEERNKKKASRVKFVALSSRVIVRAV